MATPFVVADAAVAVAADLKQYDADLRKAESSGTASGSRLANALKRDFGGAQTKLAAGAGALFGIALKAGNELTDSMAAYRAETGATAGELADVQKATADLFKSNLAGYDVIGRVMAKVRTDLGLTGQAQKEATQLALDYALVTGTDAVEAVTKLDDATDAYNLTAEEQRDVLDKLKYSQEQYGGSVDDNLQSLIALAPALKAANLTYDDGIGLLNLFAKAGVDGADSVAAMTTALRKVESPEEFRRLVADIQATEDPLLRAQKATELFGKAGQKMAQVLAQGSEGLGEFSVSTDVATGSITDASKAIENTPLNWFRLKLKELVGPLAEVAAELGPVTTGLAGLATIGATTGLGSFAKDLAKLMLEAGKKGGEALIDGIGTATGAAGTIIGNLVANILDPTNPLLGNPIRRAALKAGALWAATFALGAKVADVLVDLFVKLPGVPTLRAAILAAGIQMGTIQGTAMGRAAAVAFPLAFVGLLAWVAQQIEPHTSKLGKDIGDQIFGGVERPAFLTDVGNWLHDLEDVKIPVLTDLMRQLDPSSVPPERGWRRFGGIAGRELSEGAQEAVTRLGPPNWPVGNLERAMSESFSGIPSAIQKSGRMVAAAAREFFALPIGEQLVKIGAAGLRAGANVALGVASGLRQNRGDIDAAIAQLKEDMEHKLKPKKEVAHDIGLLFGKTLSKGLKSADGVVKAQAEGTRGLIEAQLIDTIKAGGKAGKDILDELEKKMKSKDPDVRAQAKRTKSVIDAALKETPGKNPGSQIGDQLATDLGSKGTKVGKVAYDLGRTIAINVLRGVQGVGRLQVGVQGNSTTGFYSGKAVPLAEGMNYVPYDDMLASLHKGEMVVPAKEADRIRDGLLGAGGSTSYSTTWVMPEPPTRDPFEVLDRTSRWARWGRLSPEPAGG